MPKPPLIESPTKRQIVIALVMGVVFAASLLLAWVVSGASLV